MSNTHTVSHDTLLAATAQIVGSYVMNRPEEKLQLTALMADVYATLQHLATTGQNFSKAVESVQVSTVHGTNVRKPAVQITESVKPDYIVCLEDGKRVKMLKRYLKTNYNLTPEEYKRRWDLPTSYPMVAPNYAVVRSRLAKEIGLGKRGMPSKARERLAIVAASVR